MLTFDRTRNEENGHFYNFNDFVKGKTGRRTHKSVFGTRSTGLGRVFEFGKRYLTIKLV